MASPTQWTCCCCYCCYVASVVSDSVRPRRRQPIRLHHPWDSPGKNTGMSCHFLLQCMKEKSESEVVSDSVTPWIAAQQAPPSMGFSRQEYWSGVPLSSPVCKARRLQNSKLSNLTPSPTSHVQHIVSRPEL